MLNERLQVCRWLRIRRWGTHNAPEYMAGSGATMDLFILLIRACISYAEEEINIIAEKQEDVPFIYMLKFKL